LPARIKRKACLLSLKSAKRNLSKIDKKQPAWKLDRLVFLEKEKL
jgi:hypothetical protein